METPGQRSEERASRISNRMDGSVRVSRSMQTERLLHVGFIVLSMILGAATFFVVAPQASGLGLVGADPISLIICVGIALVYGIASTKLVARINWQISSVAAISLILGATSMVWIYPAQERYATPGTHITASAKQYVERCVAGFNSNDRVHVSPRAKLFFDAFQPAQWLITIWFHDRGGSYSFYANTSDLVADCQNSLAIPGR